MPDFTCALYLGLRHPARLLRPWTQLTTGAPAALRRVPGAAGASRHLAALQGCEAATLVPSTLHAAWDLGGLLDPRADVIHLDAAIYPVLACCAVRAAARGVVVTPFGHGDTAALEQALRGATRRPVVLVDGLCPACGGPVALAAYARSVRRRGGLLVVDDTQGLGILGARDRRSAPGWGTGGGGSLRFHGLDGARDVLLVASLAKALGVPLAAVSGSAAAVAAYEERAGTRAHSSPVSVAVVHALEHALAQNAAHGELLRARLASVIERLRRALARLGVGAEGGGFPVQALPYVPRTAALRLHRRLLEDGVRTVAQPRSGGREGRIVFVLTADHGAADVDAAVAALARAPELALLRAPPQARAVA